MTKDLTQGKAIPLILSFSIPLILGNMFQQLYNLVDTIIVGRFLGVSELAAVGSTNAFNFLVLGFVNGLCGGMGIPIAQRFGAKDETGLRRFVANAYYLAIFCALILTPFMMIFTRPMMVLMLTPEDIMEDAYLYIVTVFAGIPLLFLYNLVANIIRALGDSKTPLYFLIFSSILNVFLDIFSIRVLHMGVQGPALATVCSQGLSGILCLFYMRKKFPILKFKPGEAKVRPELMKRLFLMGAPMGLQYSITAIGSVILQASVNTLGSLAVAAVTASSRLNMVFANCILDSLGAAMATYCGQNLGAGKYERIVEGIKKAILLGGIYCIFGFIVMYLFSDKLAMLFLTDTDDTVLVGMIRQWVVTNSIFYFGLCVLAVLRFSIQGLGYSMVALSSGIAEMIARIFVAWALIAPLGFTASALSNPISWVLADIALIPSILFVLKKVRKQLQ